MNVLKNHINNFSTTLKINGKDINIFINKDGSILKTEEKKLPIKIHGFYLKAILKLLFVWLFLMLLNNII